MSLTDAEIKRAPVREKAYRLADAAACLSRYPLPAAKLFRWKYRFERKEKLMALVEKSFTTISHKWLEHWKHHKSARHVDSTRRRLASNILPSLGSLHGSILHPSSCQRRSFDLAAF